MSSPEYDRSALFEAVGHDLLRSLELSVAGKHEQAAALRKRLGRRLRTLIGGAELERLARRRQLVPLVEASNSPKRLR
jgi:hypothetical protein